MLLFSHRAEGEFTKCNRRKLGVVMLFLVYSDVLRFSISCV